MYVVCSGDKEKSNGFISNSVIQVTAEPPQFAVCCNKNNYTSEFISDSGAFSISVLGQNAPADVIGNFGYKSGRELDKLSSTTHYFGETGVPVVTEGCVAIMECRLVNTFDAGTHLIFIGELVSSSKLADGSEPMTYAWYRQVKKGLSPKNAPTYIDKSKLEKSKIKIEENQYQCSACGYIYNESEGDEPHIPPGTKFEDLPDDWVCPICGAEKEDFVKL